MNSNLFDRLNTGGSFLENVYNQEELEKQAKKQAISQVKALGGLAHQQISQAIGESGVEAAVGAAGIAYPLVKKYGGQVTKDFPSMDLGGLSDVKDRIVNSVTDHVRGLRQGAAQAQRQAEDMFSGYRTSALRPTGAIDRMGAEPTRFIEVQNPAFDARALDEPSPRQVRAPAQDPDFPQVSIPRGERVARTAERRLARGIEEPQLDRPQVMDPFQIGVESKPTGDWSTQATRDPPKAAGDFDPFQDIIDQARFREERAAMQQDRVRAGKRRAVPEKQTDYDPERPTEKAHLRSIKPKEEPVQAKAGPAAPEAGAGGTAEIPAPAIPASELTGGISPANLPEGAGFSRGGLKIGAKKAVDPPSRFGEADTQDFLGEIEDKGLNVTTQTRLTNLQAPALSESAPVEEPQGFDFEAFKQKALGRVAEKTQQLEESREQEFAKAAAPREVAPSIAEQKAEAPVVPEVKPDVPEVKAPSLVKDLGEQVEKEVPEETGALELPAIGEVALAAVGVGQLIGGLIEKHKQNMEERSQEAQAMSQPVQRVAIDSSATFDSTFR